MFIIKKNFSYGNKEFGRLQDSIFFTNQSSRTHSTSNTSTNAKTENCTTTDYGNRTTRHSCTTYRNCTAPKISKTSTC